MIVFEARGPLDVERMPHFPEKGGVVALGRSPSALDAAALGDALQRWPELGLRLHDAGKLSLQHAASLPLASLEIDGCDVDPAEVAGIASLQCLALRRLPAKRDVGPLVALQSLRTLRLQGRFENVTALLACRALRALSLDGTAPPATFQESAIAELELSNVSIETPDLRLPPGLARLRLRRLVRLAWLPCLSDMRSLISLQLHALPLVPTLDPVLSAPALRRLDVRGMPLLDIHDVFRIAAMPQLERLTVSLGGRRKDREVHRAFERAHAVGSTPSSGLHKGGSPPQRE